MTSKTDPSLIKTWLRPDFYERFPVFSSAELAVRLDSMPFAMATLLSTRNIRLALRLTEPRVYLGYLRQDAETHRQALVEVLVSCGIAGEIADLIASDRHLFVGVHHRAVAYLDRTAKVVDDTYLSAPSLVAQMLGMTDQVWPAETVCEIGIGSGFHAICVARLWPQCRVVGVERNPAALATCVQHLERTELQERFTLLGDHHTASAVGSAGFVYSTAALTLPQLNRLIGFGQVGSTWLVPRQLTRAEFESEPSASWLWTRFGSYTGYCSGAWNQYVAVELFQLEAGQKRRLLDIIYDVRFIKYSETT